MNQIVASSTLRHSSLAEVLLDFTMDRISGSSNINTGEVVVMQFDYQVDCNDAIEAMAKEGFRRATCREEQALIDSYPRPYDPNAYRVRGEIFHLTFVRM